MIKAQTIVFIYQHNTAWQLTAPTPKNKVDVLFAGTYGIAPEPHSGEAGGHQAVGEGVRGGRSSGKHVTTPRWAVEFRLPDGLRGPFGPIKRIKNRIGIHLIRT